MAIAVTQYAGTRFARVSNYPESLPPPRVILKKLRGAANTRGRISFDDKGTAREAASFHATPVTTNSDTPEINLLWAILAQTLEDLSLIGRPHLHADSVYFIKAARLHLKFSDFWYCEFLGLEPEYFLRILNESGYLAPIRWRILSQKRVERWNISDAIKTRRSEYFEATRGEYAFGAIKHIERLLKNYDKPRG